MVRLYRSQRCSFYIRRNFKKNSQPDPPIRDLCELFTLDQFQSGHIVDHRCRERSNIFGQLNTIQPKTVHGEDGAFGGG